MAQSQGTALVESKKDFEDGKPGASQVRRWLAEIKAYEGTYKKWRDRSFKIIKRYRDEPLSDINSDDGMTLKNFNIFWSNVQTLQPALMSKMPKVIVKRRNRDSNKIALAASEIMQRALQFEATDCDFETPFKQSRDDHLLAGRGTVWVRYEPVYGDEKKTDMLVQPHEEHGYVDDAGKPVDASKVTQAPDGAWMVPGGGGAYKPVVDEKVYVDHVIWSEFGHTPAPSWKLVSAVWRRVEMTREQLIKRFGEDKGKKVGLTKQVVGISAEQLQLFGDVFKRGEVYEIWDKDTKKAIWISPGYTDDVLDSKDDPLGLRDFFPCPSPFYATLTTDSLIPVPDYVEYQAQAIQLDILTQRIAKLTDAMKVAGAYDASFPALENIIKGPENVLIPVDSWAMFAEKGGLTGVISFMPIKEIAETIIRLTETRQQVKQDLYEVTGLSDLVRGQSAPSATATAERLKDRFISLRLKDRQAAIVSHVRDTIALVGEVMSEHFNPQLLISMSGWLESTNAKVLGEAAPQVAQEAVAMLRDDAMRTFRIDIETDSAILEDQEAERQSRIDFLTATSQFLQQAVPAAQEYPAIRPLLGQMLLYGVRSFDVGTEMEEVFEQAVQAFNTAMQDPQAQQQQPNPELIKAQGELEIKKRDLDIKEKQHGDEMAFKQQEAQHLEQDRQRQHEIRLEELKIQLRELDIKIKELDIKREELQQADTHHIDEMSMRGREMRQVDDHKNRDESLELTKLADARDGRQDDHAHAERLADKKKEADLEVASHGAKHEENMKRLEGKVTPTFEDDMKVVSSGQENLIKALLQMVEKQGEQMTKVLQMIAAPRKLLTDPKTGRPIGSAPDMETMGNA